MRVAIYWEGSGHSACNVDLGAESTSTLPPHPPRLQPWPRRWSSRAALRRYQEGNCSLPPIKHSSRDKDTLRSQQMLRPSSTTFAEQLTQNVWPLMVRLTTVGWSRRIGHARLTVAFGFVLCCRAIRRAGRGEEARKKRVG